MLSFWKLLARADVPYNIDELVLYSFGLAYGYNSPVKRKGFVFSVDFNFFQIFPTPVFFYLFSSPFTPFFFFFLGRAV